MSFRPRLEGSRSTARGATPAHADVEGPGQLSPATWKFLGHHVERAFARPGAWRPTLRRAVRRATAELDAVGAGPAVVREVLERSVLEHSACARYDRMLIVTREWHSHRVLAAMHAWVEEDRSSSPARLP